MSISVASQSRVSVSGFTNCVLPHSPLPHGLRTESGDVCLFTRDEPNMSAEQTERFYKKLLTERGVKNVTEVFHRTLQHLSALLQTLSFSVSAGHGFKSAKVPQGVSRQVSFSVGARLYKL